MMNVIPHYVLALVAHHRFRQPRPRKVLVKSGKLKYIKVFESIEICYSIKASKFLAMILVLDNDEPPVKRAVTNNQNCKKTGWKMTVMDPSSAREIWDRKEDEENLLENAHECEQSLKCRVRSRHRTPGN